MACGFSLCDVELKQSTADPCIFIKHKETGEKIIIAVYVDDLIVVAKTNQEMTKFNIDSYIVFGGELDFINWRTMTPLKLYSQVNEIILKRLY